LQIEAVLIHTWGRTIAIVENKKNNMEDISSFSSAIDKKCKPKCELPNSPLHVRGLSLSSQLVIATQQRVNPDLASQLLEMDLC